MSDHGHFSSYEEGQQEAATGQDSWGVFRGYAQDIGRLDACSCAGFISSRPPPPWTLAFHFFLILHDMTCGLENLGFLIESIYFSYFYTVAPMGADVAVLPFVTEDLPISPRFTPYECLSRCKFSTLSTRQPIVEVLLTHVLTLSATDTRMKILL